MAWFRIVDNCIKHLFDKSWITWAAIACTVSTTAYCQYCNLCKPICRAAKHPYIWGKQYTVTRMWHTFYVTFRYNFSSTFVLDDHEKECINSTKNPTLKTSLSLINSRYKIYAQFIALKEVPCTFYLTGRGDVATG